MVNLCIECKSKRLLDSEFERGVDKNTHEAKQLEEFYGIRLLCTNSFTPARHSRGRFPQRHATTGQGECDSFEWPHAPQKDLFSYVRIAVHFQKCGRTKSSHFRHRSNCNFFAVANMSNDFLLDRLSIHAKEQPDKKVFSFIGPGIDGGRIQKSYTYNELATETSRVAHVLLSSGLAAGDRCVAINTAV